MNFSIRILVLGRVNGLIRDLDEVIAEREAISAFRFSHSGFAIDVAFPFSEKVPQRPPDISFSWAESLPSANAVQIRKVNKQSVRVMFMASNVKAKVGARIVKIGHPQTATFLATVNSPGVMPANSRNSWLKCA